MYFVYYNRNQGNLLDLEMRIVGRGMKAVIEKHALHLSLWSCVWIFLSTTYDEFSLPSVILFNTTVASNFGGRTTSGFAAGSISRVRLVAPATVTGKSTVFLDITTCSQVELYRYFDGMNCRHLRGINLIRDTKRAASRRDVPSGFSLTPPHETKNNIKQLFWTSTRLHANDI
jgi:hypothetical protein